MFSMVSTFLVISPSVCSRMSACVFVLGFWSKLEVSLIAAEQNIRNLSDEDENRRKVEKREGFFLPNLKKTQKCQRQCLLYGKEVKKESRQTPGPFPASLHLARQPFNPKRSRALSVCSIGEGGVQASKGWVAKKSILCNILYIE